MIGRNALSVGSVVDSVVDSVDRSIVAFGPRVFPDTDEQILPDVEIKISSEDYLSRKNVMLEYILHD